MTLDDDRRTRNVAAWITIVHLACCGLPIVALVLLSIGLSIDALWSAAPVIAAAGALVGVGWFVW